MAYALTIEERYCSLNHYDLQMDREIRSQVGVQPLPFSGMDKSQAMMCELFALGKCQLGNQCCYRHIQADRMIVCKHWLRGLCKKGDGCEFLHQYDMSKMPICYFYSNFGRCENRDCMYQHINPEAQQPECPWYARGHCKHGSLCKRRHVRKIMCVDYMIGFCPNGPDCEYEHPKWEVPQFTEQAKVIRCHYCQELGHKSNVCEKNPNKGGPFTLQNFAEPQAPTAPGETAKKLGMPRNKEFLESQPQLQKQLDQQKSDKAVWSIPTLDEGVGASTQTKLLGEQSEKRISWQEQKLMNVTCFKCLQKGHYANNCTIPKGEAGPGYQNYFSHRNNNDVENY